jgi:hypothetical protein
LGNHAEAYLAKNEGFAKAFQSRSVGRRTSEFGTRRTGHLFAALPLSGDERNLAYTQSEVRV